MSNLLHQTRQKRRKKRPKKKKKRKRRKKKRRKRKRKKTRKTRVRRRRRKIRRRNEIKGKKMGLNLENFLTRNLHLDKGSLQRLWKRMKLMRLVQYM